MILQKVPIIFIAFLFVLTFYSCKLINPPEDTPSYIKIDTIVFKTNVSYDENSSNITDAWVYVDDQIIGAFELPAKFPVLLTGKHRRIDIKPGIKLNGIDATHSAYPFYTTFSVKDTDLTPGKVILVRPVTSYINTVNFVWKENFENPNLTIQKTNRSDTNIKIIPNAGEYYYKYGDKNLGIINVTIAKPYFECQTDTSYALPSYGSKPVFLEIDYYSTNSLTISIESISSSGINMQEYLTINKSNKWKKIYVNLTPPLSFFPDATGFKIFLSSRLESQLSQGTVVLDNIKLIIGS